MSRASNNEQSSSEHEARSRIVDALILGLVVVIVGGLVAAVVVTS